MFQFFNFKYLVLAGVVCFGLGYCTALRILSTKEQKNLIETQKQQIETTKDHYCKAEEIKNETYKPDCADILNFDISNCLYKDSNEQLLPRNP